MSLSPGTRFGAYEVAAQIGVGGMGEVYRARDSRLNRDVALKVLPDSFVNDPDRLARFQREAQVLASLNHPNIAAIYGVEEVGGTRALVMELVDGPTLDERIAKAAVPIDEAINMATQIAEALGAAHDQGIVHRDLKPANIKVKPDGTVKVLDFGLAKAEPAPSSEGPNFSSANPAALSQSPTITTPAMTQIGVLLGTAAYMSPEQAKGRPADKRSDVWAFGCVFYEILTGTRAFAEDDISETLAAILKSEPDWTRIPSDVPPVIRTLVQRCLVKDRRQRVADISAAKFVLCELGNLGNRPAAANVTAAPRSRWRRVLPPLAAAAVAAAIVGAVMWMLRPVPRAPAVAQFSFPLSDGEALSGTRQAIAISPDGTRVAYAANSRIYVRSVGDLQIRAIPGTENSDVLGLLNPMFAPDGESIAYFLQPEASSSGTGFVLKRISINGGPSSTLATTGALYGATWTGDSILVGQVGNVVRVSADGSGTSVVVRVSTGERVHRPQLLPGGKAILASLISPAADDFDQGQVVAISVADGTRTVLVDGAVDARYVPTGHLMYAVGGTMFAAPFDVTNLTLTKAAVPVVVGVRRGIGRATTNRQIAVSDSGTLAYVPGSAKTGGGVHLAISDGREQPTTLNVPPGAYSHPRVSPDGKVAAVARAVGQESDIWTYELAGKSELLRFTFGGTNRFPVWSGDGKRIAFQSAREGDRGIFLQAANGGSGVERLTRARDGEEHRPESWSRDGTHLLFTVAKNGKYALWVMMLADKKEKPFAAVQSAEPLSASFSPDGRWVVYASTPVAGGVLSANRGIFMQRFPATSELHQAPKKFLDFHPAWSPDGKGIFYIPGSTRPIVFVPVVTQPTVAFQAPIDLQRGPFPGLLSGEVRGYDVLPDGRLLSLTANAGDSSSSSSTEIRVVLNWFEELKRLVPAK